MKRKLIPWLIGVSAVGALACAFIWYSSASYSTANQEDSAPDSSTINLGGITIKFVWVPPGEFVMGDDRYADEAPSHRVRITKGFWLGRCEVTNAQFRRFCPDHDSGMYGGRDLDGDDQPVVMVNWYEANAFCEWLGEEAEGSFRLPTEAEWEYACRAGTQSRFSFGDTPDRMGEYAWYDQNSKHTSHPVGQKKENAWGLHDMHGNVFEWCADWAAKGYSTRNPSRDPKGPDAGEKRVLRGGGWAHFPEQCTVSSRFWAEPQFRQVFYGFRVVFESEIRMTRE